MLRKTIQILLTVFLFNVLTWFFIGRGQTLSLALDFYDHFSPNTAVDTLFIPSKIYHIEPEGQRIEFGDLSVYSYKKRNNFLQKVTELSGAQQTVFIDSTYRFFHDYEGDHFNLYFFTDIERNYPLYTSVYSGVTVYGYGATYSDKYIWFFNWWPLGIGSISES